MPSVTTPYGDLWYANHYKDPQQLPLLLVHGAGATHLDFPPTLRRLNGLAVDLPAHGKSAGSGYSTIAEYATALWSFLDTLQIPEVLLLGHSMGGAIIQMMAVQQPQRVKGLVLIATGAALSVNEALLNGLRVAAHETLTQVVKWGWAKTATEAQRKLSLERLLSVPPQVILGDYRACSQFDGRAQLPHLTMPALVIGGTLDKMTPFAWSEYLAEHLPNAELLTLEGGGHMLMLEQAEKVGQAVAAWRYRHFLPQK
jgi:pimeloyl-ACP methyl ester carboxylesterase